MDPCGTPHCKSAEVENLSSVFTWNFLLGRYDLYQSITSREDLTMVFLEVMYYDLWYQMLLESQ